MAGDYGGVRMRGAGGLLVAVAVLAVVGVAGFYGYLYLRDQQKAAARARAFAMQGAPCQEISRAEFEARRLKVRNVFAYEGVAFGRAAGHADCAALKEGMLGLKTTPACQFTSPAALTVRTPKAERFYVVGVGRPATVLLRGGEARCLQGGNFTMESLIGR